MESIASRKNRARPRATACREVMKKKTVSRSGGLRAEPFARSPLGLIVEPIAIVALPAQCMLGDERVEQSRADVGAQPEKPLGLVPCQSQARHLFEFRADAVQQLLRDMWSRRSGMART